MFLATINPRATQTIYVLIILTDQVDRKYSEKISIFSGAKGFLTGLLL
jgi:hypothetical protein